MALNHLTQNQAFPHTSQPTRIQCQFENTWTLHLQKTEAPERKWSVQHTLFSQVDNVCNISLAFCVRQVTGMHIKVSILLAADGSHFLEKWTLNTTTTTKTMPADNTFFSWKLKLISCVLKIVSPRKLKPKFCSLNRIWKTEQSNFSTAWPTMILFSYYTLFYPIQSLQLKQKQQPDQMVPTPSSSCPHVCT